MAEIGAVLWKPLKKQAEEIHTKQKELEAKIDDLKYQIRKKMPLKRTAMISSQEMKNFLRKNGNSAVPLRKKRHLRFILPGRKIKNMTAWKHRHRKKWNRCPVSAMYRKINWWMYVWIIFRIIQNVISQRAQRIMTIMTACSRSFPAMNWKNTRKSGWAGKGSSGAF